MEIDVQVPIFFNVTAAPPADVAVSPGDGEAVLIVPVPGPPGPQGPVGVGSFTHVQAVAAGTWIVSHDLGRFPNGAQLTLPDGEVVHADVVYPDASTAVVTFAFPQAGTLRLT
jgi:hypothetical protein